MRGRELGALILASSLITLDGTAVTVALPAIGRDLGVSLSRLQWITNAPLLMLAALLLPAGAVADRYGRRRAVHAGLVVSLFGSAVAFGSADGTLLVTGRLVHGAGSALILPAVLAILRSAYHDPAERVRKLGAWAAATGAAGVLGPLLGGVLVDVVSWRAVFLVPAACALTASVLLGRGRSGDSAPSRQPVPVVAGLALVGLLGAVAYVLIEGVGDGWRAPGVLGAALMIPVSAAVFGGSRRGALLPRELFQARNCIFANAATFALYFGLFGISFLLVLYTQQELQYSGTWAAASVLPISLMLLFAEPFGRLAARLGTRGVVIVASLVASAGVLWIATGTSPLPFTSRIVVGAAAFGLGISLAVSALTHAAVSAVPDSCAGAASGFSHAIVRAGGLVAIAFLGSLAAGGQADGISVEGFHQAMWICGLVVGAGGIAAGSLLRDDEPGGLDNGR